MRLFSDPTAAIFLGLFLFGLGFSALSFLLGAGPDSSADVSSLDLSGSADEVAFSHDAVGAGTGVDAAQVVSDTLSSGEALSVINTMTLTGFVTWFGAAGYLAHAYGGAPLVVSLFMGLIGGLSGGYLVYLFLFKLLLRGQTRMRQSDYRLVGTIAKVSVPIAPGGTGEVVFAKGGATRSEGARGGDDERLEQGEEVVIVRYEKGLAYVQQWNRFVGTSSRGAAPIADDNG
ncbi:MAG: hypothetical protein HY329_19575 [Chloroflexi bacterium]|nr:hypothetical protein [Chloroflexota bacterium]